jgi:hypothetical protein
MLRDGAKMIDLKSAVNVALDHIKLFERIMPTDNVRLEEFDFDADQGEWLITLSFAEGSFAGVSMPRTYKVFAIDGDTGYIRRMKIRNPLAPAR